MNYRTDRNIKPGANLKELLMNLTKKELQQIRKNWEFKGISNLNKEELADELYTRIPKSLNRWLKIIINSIFEMLEELVYEERAIEIEIHHEEDIRVLKYLQERGIIFYGRNKGRLMLVMPDEIKDGLKHLIDFDSVTELDKNIENNTEIVLLTIGLVVHYGVHPTIDVHSKIKSHLDFELDTYDYYQVIYEFMSAYDIIYNSNNRLILEYVMKPEEVLAEQDKRSQLDFYEASKDELMHAGNNVRPPINDEYEELIDFFRKNDVDDEQIELIINTIFLDVNNDIPYSELLERVEEIINIKGIDEVNELNKYVMAAYNNTRQWFLKGHTPAEVSNNSVERNETAGRDNVIDFNKYKNEANQ